MNEKVKELSDEELEKVNGGGEKGYYFETPACTCFKWKIGDHVELITCDTFFHTFTKGCTIINRTVGEYAPGHWQGKYQVNCSDSYLSGWYFEYEFEHGTEYWWCYNNYGGTIG